VEAYDGPQIVGIDLHRRRSVLVRARMAGSWPPRGSQTARRGWPRRSGGRPRSPRCCRKPATAGNGQRIRWRRSAPRCTWRTRWESKVSATAGSKTTSSTPAIWPTYSWKVASLRQLIGWLTAKITVLEQVSVDLLAAHDAYLPAVSKDAVTLRSVGALG